MTFSVVILFWPDWAKTCLQQRSIIILHFPWGAQSTTGPRRERAKSSSSSRRKGKKMKSGNQDNVSKFTSAETISLLGFPFSFTRPHSYRQPPPSNVSFLPSFSGGRKNYENNCCLRRRLWWPKNIFFIDWSRIPGTHWHPNSTAIPLRWTFHLAPSHSARPTRPNGPGFPI